MTTHTPDYGEPWYEDEAGNLRSREHRLVSDRSRSIRHRKRVCVNACAGLPNTFLESGGIGRMRARLVDCRAFIAGIAAALPTTTPVRAAVDQRLTQIDALLSEMSAPADAEKADG